MFLNDCHISPKLIIGLLNSGLPSEKQETLFLVIALNYWQTCQMNHSAVFLSFCKPDGFVKTGMPFGKESGDGYGWREPQKEERLESG